MKHFLVEKELKIIYSQFGGKSLLKDTFKNELGFNTRKYKPKKIDSERIDYIKDLFSKNNIGVLQSDAVFSCIQELKEINTFRGNRHRKKLPVRGQRSRTNGKTFRKQSLFSKKVKSKK